MTRSRVSRLERQAKKIIDLKVEHDHVGNYLSFCKFGVHPGVLGYQKARECREKGCKHYRILRKF